MFVLSWANWILAAKIYSTDVKKIFHVLENAVYGTLESQHFGAKWVT